MDHQGEVLGERGCVARQNKRNNGAIMLMDIKEGVVWEKGVRGGEDVVCLRGGARCERLAVVLWAGWKCKGLWRDGLGMIVSNLNGDV